jgi:hypothetical protein
MEFDLKRGRSTVHYTVTKVNLSPKIDDNIFLIPTDYDVKPMSELNMGGGAGQIKIKM